MKNVINFAGGVVAATAFLVACGGGSNNGSAINTAHANGNAGIKQTHCNAFYYRISNDTTSTTTTNHVLSHAISSVIGYEYFFRCAGEEGKMHTFETMAANGWILDTNVGFNHVSIWYKAK